MADYTVRNHNTPIGVAEWATATITVLPAELASRLPSIADIEAERIPHGDDEAP